MIFIDFHRFQVAEAQDDASIEALKGFRKTRIPLIFNGFCVLTGF